MIKQVIDYLDFGFFAELALALFMLIFLSVVIRTLLLGREMMNQQAHIVLDDNAEERS